MPDAIAIIRDEHRSFAAVLQGLTWLVTEIRERRLQPDFELFAAMLAYIRAFPEKLHHPKEDAYVYARLRQRHPGIAPVLDELEAEHARGREFIVELADALYRYRRDGEPAFAAFDAAATAYADFHWAHMRKEEDLVLPIAETALTADDWKAIDAAFASNDDPLVGIEATRESRELFRRIVNLAPPPIGVGPASP